MKFALLLLMLVIVSCASPTALPIAQICNDNNDATCSSDWALCWNACRDRRWADDPLQVSCGQYPACLKDCERFVGVTWAQAREGDGR